MACKDKSFEANISITFCDKNLDTLNKEWQCSWQAVLCDAPKVLAILDHFYDPELLQNSTEARS